MSRSASVIATAGFLPPQRISNDDLRRRFGDGDRVALIDRFEAQSGIRQRWQAPDHWCTSDLALPAAQQALQTAGLRATELDFILVGTDTPDRITPATSTRLQALLGATTAGTFDIGCACASFPSAIATAAGLIAGNRGLNRVLVVGAYLMSRFADPEDPMTFFYGDGAGAAILEATDRPGYLAASFLADGRYADHWSIEAGGTREPASRAAIDAGRTRVRVSQRYPPEINEEGWPSLVRSVLERADQAIADVHAFIFTQVNRTTIERVCERLELPPERAIMTMEDCGYTGSACVPIALDRALRTGRIGPGDLVVLVGSGVGYNMAAVALRLNERIRLGASRSGALHLA